MLIILDIISIYAIDYVSRKYCGAKITTLPIITIGRIYNWNATQSWVFTI